MLTALTALLLLAQPAGSDRTQTASGAIQEAPAGAPTSPELDMAKDIALIFFELVDREGFDIDAAPIRQADAGDPNMAAWHALVERRREFGRPTAREVDRIGIVERPDREEWIVRFRTDFERFRGAYEIVVLNRIDGNFIPASYRIE